MIQRSERNIGSRKNRTVLKEQGGQRYGVRSRLMRMKIMSIHKERKVRRRGLVGG